MRYCLVELKVKMGTSLSTDCQDSHLTLSYQPLFLLKNRKLFFNSIIHESVIIHFIIRNIKPLEVMLIMKSVDVFLSLTSTTSNPKIVSFIRTEK